MSWNDQRCYRIIRPLKAQINKYLAYVKTEPSSTKIELLSDTSLICHLLKAEATQTYSRRKKDASKLVSSASAQMLHNLKRLLNDDYYEQCVALLNIVEQFIGHSKSSVKSLSEKSAYRLGATMASHCDTIDEEVEWHSSIDIFDDRFRKHLTLGHGIGLICRSAGSLKILLPVVIQHCIDINERFLATQFLASYIESMIEIDQFVFYFDTLTHFSIKLNTNLDTLILKSQEFGPAVELIDPLTQLLTRPSHIDTNTLNGLVIAVVRKLKKAKNCAKLADFFVNLMKVYFKHCQWSPSILFISCIYRQISLRDDSLAMFRQSLLVYLSMAHEENLIDLDGLTVHQRSEIQRNIINLFDEPDHFKTLCEYFISDYPSFVTELSHTFLERHCDLSTVTWQDELTSQVLSSTADDEYEYDKVLGVWVSSTSDHGTSSSDSESDNSIVTFIEDEEDDVSLISIHSNRQIKNNVVRPTKRVRLLTDSDDEDDISLIMT
ncbi:hypothetical protein TRVA0_018S02278 [Trichomonascus vanleenenianus]|uniref:uncharacterized protein n=1 Tax=Trichomonascus vanleenenianus TaxID=2268995 RepID=UPI003EC98866